MRKKKRKKKKFSIFSCIILIFSIIIIFFNSQAIDFVKDIFSFGKISFDKTASILFSTDIEYDEDLVFDISEKGIIISEKNKFKYYNENGVEIWEKEINNSEPKIIMTKNNIIVADMGVGDIFILDYLGNIKSKIDGTGSIKKLFSSDNDVIGVTADNENIIVLYDDKFEIISKILIPQGEVIDFDISNKKSLIAVSLIKSDESNFYSNLIIYGLDGEMVGATNFESKYVYDIKVVEDKIIVILDNEVVAINSNNEIIFSKEIDRSIVKFSIDDMGNTILNLEKDKTDITDTRNDNVISSLSIEGKELFKEIKIDENVSKIGSNSKFLSLALGSKLYYFDKITGENLKIQDFNEDIEEVFLIKNKLYLKHIDKINIYEVIN